ncbi:MAG: hypothetical protein B6I28_05215 [Fusobacteriia bacterium 4572_132]|nr:MAG: hypothetical protein B6I28_05215 [Fusobacteriia bacterium 4572_132]
MYSHPGKELKEHLLNVKILGMKIYKEKNTIWSKDIKIEKALEIILYTHDFGKATSYFQEYINNPKSKKWIYPKNKKLKAHSKLSAYWTYYLINKKLKDKKIAIISYLIVLRHHGNITDFNPKNFSNEKVLKEQLQEFDFSYFNLLKEKESFFEELEKINDWDFEDELYNTVDSFIIEDFLLLSYLFSILISADKGEVIYYNKNKEFQELVDIKFKEKEINKNSVDNYKNKKFGKPKIEMDKIREEIYKEVEKNILKENLEKNKIFSVNVPTGTGKTLTSFNLALKLRNQLGNKYKIIYTLPFTSIIEQNYKIINEVLENPNSEMLLKHHYLAKKEYKKSEESFTYDISEYLIENWDSEVIITTFVQLLESILSNKNRKMKKIHNITNSIIILDEVQSISHKYWELIKQIFIKIAKCYNTYIILVTATLPLLFSEEKNEIMELAKSKEKYFNQFNRINLNLEYIKEKMNLDQFTKIILKDIIGNKANSYLFIMNTIKSSLRIYNELKEEVKENYEIIYLSTNVIPKERLARIEKIKRSKQVIIVSTQLIEAGVDIDIERVYRDMASFDSINQSCGRCNRNNKGKKKGEVIVVDLIDENNKNKEFAKYIYGDILLENTKKILFEKEKIEERDFFKLSNEYYKNINKVKSDDFSNDILKNIENLNYKEAFEGDKGFKLIEDNFKTVDLFISCDENGEKLWKEYENIKNIEKFDRKEAFDKIKSEFLSYVISVPEKYYLGAEEGFNLVDKNTVENYYNLETGFKRNEEQEDYFF